MKAAFSIWALEKFPIRVLLTVESSVKVGLIRRGYSATGGAERYLLRLAEGLEKAGHSVILFSDRLWPEEVWAAKGRDTILVGGEEDLELPDRAEKPDGFIATLKARILSWIDAAIAFYHKQMRRYRMSPSAFADQLRDEVRPRDHCDCLFSLERVWDCDCFRAGDGVHAAWMKRRAKYESALQTFAHRFTPKHRQIIELEKALYTNNATGPHIIANSRMVANEIVEIYGTRLNRITVVPNGYDLPLITAMERERVRKEERAALGLGEFDTAFLFVGSGWSRKGLRFAIYAAERIANLDGDKDPVRLLVAGHDKHAGKEISSQPGHAIQFLGPVDAVVLGRLFLAADVFVLPTIYDPFSNATLEAAAFGLPIITTDANGFAEHMPPFAGSVIDRPDSGLLLTAFREWRNSQKREGVFETNTALATELSVAKNTEASIAVFLELIERRKLS